MWVGYPTMEERPERWVWQGRFPNCKMKNGDGIHHNRSREKFMREIVR